MRLTRTIACSTLATGITSRHVTSRNVTSRSSAMCSLARWSILVVLGCIVATRTDAQDESSLSIDSVVAAASSGRWWLVPGSERDGAFPPAKKVAEFQLRSLLVATEKPNASLAEEVRRNIFLEPSILSVTKTHLELSFDEDFVREAISGVLPDDGRTGWSSVTVLVSPECVRVRQFEYDLLQNTDKTSVLHKDGSDEIQHKTPPQVDFFPEGSPYGAGIANSFFPRPAKLPSDYKAPSGIEISGKGPTENGDRWVVRAPTGRVFEFRKDDHRLVSSSIDCDSCGAPTAEAIGTVSDSKWGWRVPPVLFVSRETKGERIRVAFVKSIRMRSPSRDDCVLRAGKGAVAAVHEVEGVAEYPLLHDSRNVAEDIRSLHDGGKQPTLANRPDQIAIPGRPASRSWWLPLLAIVLALTSGAMFYRFTNHKG